MRLCGNFLDFRINISCKIFQNEYYEKKKILLILQIWLELKNYSGENLKNYQFVKDISCENVDLLETPWKLQSLFWQNSKQENEQMNK